MKDIYNEKIKEFKNKYIFKEDLTKEEVKEKFNKLNGIDEILEIENLINDVSELNQEEQEEAVEELKNTIKDIATSRLFDENFKEIKEYLIYVDKRIEALINNHDYTAEEVKIQEKICENFVIDSLKQKGITLELFIEDKINEFETLNHSDKLEEFEKLMILINEENEETKETLRNNLIEKMKKSLVIENYSNGYDFAKDVQKAKEIILKNSNLESKINSIIEETSEKIEEKNKDLDLVDNIIDKINMLSSINNETLIALYIEIIEDINKVTDDNEKKELYSKLISELKDMLIDSKEIENEEQLNELIEKIKENLIEFDASTENLLNANNFNLESIKKSRAHRKVKYESEITEIERLEEFIKDQENNIYSKIVPNYLINNLDKNLILINKVINNEEDKEKKEQLAEMYNSLKKDKDYLIENGENCSKKTLKEMFERNFEGNYEETIKNILIETSNNIDEEIIKLEEEKKSLELSVKSMEFLVTNTSKMFEDLKNVLESKEEKAQINIVDDKVEILVKKENEERIYTTKDNEVLKLLDTYNNETNLEEKEKIIERLKETILNSDLKVSTKSLPLQIELLNQEYDNLKKDLNNEKIGIKKLSGINNPTIELYLNNKKIMSINNSEVVDLYNLYINESNEEEKEKIEQKLKDKILKIKAQEIKNKEKKLSEIEERKIEIASKKEIKKELDLITDLEKQKEVYYNILSDGINEFNEKENEENINEKIENFVNNHEKLSIFENYPRKEKIKKELIEQIQEGIKTKKATFTDEMQNIWNKAIKKALPFALGTVSGFKLSMLASSVPVVREVLLVTSVTKITISTINKLADNAKMYEETGEYKGKMPIGLAKGALNLRNKIVSIVSNKKPNWIEKANKMREKMKQTPINYFLNGVSIGYIAGNIYQLSKANNIANELNNNSNDTTNKVVEGVSETPSLSVETVVDPVTETTVETITDTVTETAEIINFDTLDTTINNLEGLIEQGLIPKKGDVMDLSSILRGYISSDATNSVPLMEEVAKNAIFEKISVSPTGELMCHFKQANGFDYSWIKLKDVLKVTGEDLIKGIKRI